MCVASRVLFQSVVALVLGLGLFNCAYAQDNNANWLQRQFVPKAPDKPAPPSPKQSSSTPAAAQQTPAGTSQPAASPSADPNMRPSAKFGELVERVIKAGGGSFTKHSASLVNSERVHLGAFLTSRHYAAYNKLGGDQLLGSLSDKDFDDIVQGRNVKQILLDVRQKSPDIATNLPSDDAAIGTKAQALQRLVSAMKGDVKSVLASLTQSPQSRSPSAVAPQAAISTPIIPLPSSDIDSRDSRLALARRLAHGDRVGKTYDALMKIFPRIIEEKSVGSPEQKRCLRAMLPTLLDLMNKNRSNFLEQIAIVYADIFTANELREIESAQTLSPALLAQFQRSYTGLKLITYMPDVKKKTEERFRVEYTRLLLENATLLDKRFKDAGCRPAKPGLRL